jgi:hypothetical protein
VVIDEAHHVLPADLIKAGLAIPQDIKSFLVATVSPELVHPSILRAANGIITVGAKPESVIGSFNRGAGANVKARRYAATMQTGQVLVWCLENHEAPRRVTLEPPAAQRRRHRRKYAAGELGEDKSFYFRGPGGKLNLRAQNMNLFAQMAEGLDEETWKFHLSNRDYSRWLRESIKDDELAQMVAQIEKNKELSVAESSFGAADRSEYQVVGTKGSIRMNSAYEMVGDLKSELAINRKRKKTTYKKRDQFGPELAYFSKCILNDEEPEPNNAS